MNFNRNSIYIKLFIIISFFSCMNSHNLFKINYSDFYYIYEELKKEDCRTKRSKQNFLLNDNMLPHQYMNQNSHCQLFTKALSNKSLMSYSQNKFNYEGRYNFDKEMSIKVHKNIHLTNYGSAECKKMYNQRSFNYTFSAQKEGLSIQNEDKRKKIFQSDFESVLVFLCKISAIFQNKLVLSNELHGKLSRLVSVSTELFFNNFQDYWLRKDLSFLHQFINEIVFSVETNKLKMLSLLENDKGRDIFWEDITLYKLGQLMNSNTDSGALCRKNDKIKLKLQHHAQYLLFHDREKKSEKKFSKNRSSLGAKKFSVSLLEGVNKNILYQDSNSNSKLYSASKYKLNKSIELKVSSYNGSKFHEHRILSLDKTKAPKNELSQANIWITPFEDRYLNSTILNVRPKSFSSTNKLYYKDLSSPISKITDFDRKYIKIDPQEIVKRKSVSNKKLLENMCPSFSCKLAYDHRLDSHELYLENSYDKRASFSDNKNNRGPIEHKSKYMGSSDIIDQSKENMLSRSELRNMFKKK